MASDNRRIHCASCGREIGTSQTVAPTTKMREARELLERWSNTPLLDPFGPLPEPRPHAAPIFDGAADIGESEDTSARSHRLDGAHSLQPPPGVEGLVGSRTSDFTDDWPETHGDQEFTARSRAWSTHPAAAPWSGAAAGPHFDAAASAGHGPSKKGSWSSTLGQLMAYGGVGLITIGTTLVLSGYFGGPASYAPTGWLVTTAGQMLLFLGVVTLVSGGMEQTTAEVARRIDTLGDKILRIELASRGHALRGPSVGAERFSRSEVGSRKSEQEERPVRRAG